MKALTSIISIIILIVLSGCSDNSNPIINSEEIVINETNVSDQVYLNKKLIWHNNGISVTADRERFVEN